MIKETAGEAIVGKKTEVEKRLPFHKSIVEVIGEAFSHEQMELLAKLIRATVIPEDHTRIAVAWTKRCRELKSYYDYGIGEDLAERHEEKKRKKAAEAAKGGGDQTVTC